MVLPGPSFSLFLPWWFFPFFSAGWPVSLRKDSLTLFLLTALVPWTYFANSLTTATNSVVAYQTIITKVYFPRLLLPLAAVIEGLVDFIIALTLLFVMMIFYRLPLTGLVGWLPFFLFIAIMAAFGVSLWFSALNVRYRDVRYAINFLVQVWLFATPIAYSSSLVPVKWRWLYGLNPMVGVVEGFRWAILGRTSPDFSMITVSLAIILLVCIGGLGYFRRVERTFADLV